MGSGTLFVVGDWRKQTGLCWGDPVRHLEPNPRWVVLGDEALLLLKRGATGWSVNPCQPEDDVVCDGYVGSARLGDIDFYRMRQPIVAAAPSYWERAHRIAAGRTWEPFKDIRRRVAKRKKFRTARSPSMMYDHALDEWRSQPVVKQLCEDKQLDHRPHLLDPTMLPRDDYIQHCVQHAPVLSYCNVLTQNGLLIYPDETDLLSKLDDDTVLSYLIYHDV